MTDIRAIKKANSETKIAELKSAFGSATEVSSLPDLTIFVTGSYARLEASEFSDIDLFFVSNKKLEALEDPNIRSLRMFSKVVAICDELKFPGFSNDGEYLKILEKSTILDHLGDRDDDYLNHFTARLLMILESQVVAGQNIYEIVLKDILEAYFRDYPDHPKNFKPTFLVNDILRFWKTLCLNYENKRNQPVSDETRVIAQKIKNLKLKFSRMLTCFGSICYIVSENGDIGHKDIMMMSQLSPLERLEHAAKNFPKITSQLEDAVCEYEWFLTLTNVHEDELMKKFSEKKLRKEAFDRAATFGDCIYGITRHIAEENNYLRFLLV